MHSASSMKTDFRHLRRDPFLRILGHETFLDFLDGKINKNQRQNTHGARRYLFWKNITERSDQADLGGV